MGSGRVDGGGTQEAQKALSDNASRNYLVSPTTLSHHAMYGAPPGLIPPSTSSLIMPGSLLTESMYYGSAYQGNGSLVDHRFPPESSGLSSKREAGSQPVGEWGHRRRRPPSGAMLGPLHGTNSVGQSGLSRAMELSVNNTKPNSHRVHKPCQPTRQSINTSSEVLLSLNNYGNPDPNQYWPQPLHQQGENMTGMDTSYAGQRCPDVQGAYTYRQPPLSLSRDQAPRVAAPASHTSYPASHDPISK
jgi:hypothetical protein